MEKACYRGRIVRPSEFEILAGKESRASKDFPVCCICKNQVHPYGTHGTSTPERFDHKDGVATCPLSATADPRYASLRPRSVNPHQSQQVKSEYLSGHSKHAKLFCKHLAGAAFSQATYNKMLDEADKLAIWSYSGLEMWVVPYVLLTLVDFDVPPSDARDGYRFAFVFDKPSKGTIDDLWLRASDCRFKKVFAPSGKLMTYPAGNPYPVSEAFFNSVPASPR